MAAFDELLRRGAFLREAPQGIAAHAARAAVAAVAVLATLTASADSAGASTWTVRQLAPIHNSESQAVQIQLSGISCPSASLCVAVGGRQGTIAFSQNPTGGAGSWHTTKLEYPVGPGKTCAEGEEGCAAPSGALQAVSCASPNFCALTTYDGWVFASSDPSGGTGAWSAVNVNGKGQKGADHLTSVSCPSAGFCAAVSGGFKNPNGGRVLTSTNPNGGQWQSATLDEGLDLRSVSCGTPSLCVAAGRGGQLFASTDPTGGAGAWQAVTTPAGAGDLEGASCVSTALCAVGNMAGNILTSTNPAAGGADWGVANAGGSVQITGVSCPSANACVAVDNNGDVMTSTDPTGGAGGWSFENLMPFTPEGEPHNALFGASCASVSLCALVGSESHIFTSTAPFAAPGPPTRHQGRRAPRRPKTFLLFAEDFGHVNWTRHHLRIRARFRFFSPTKTRGFECKRDHGPYRRCDSPLRYWASRGHHVLRVRAIGPTGLHGRPATQRFCAFATLRVKRSQERGCGVPQLPTIPGTHVSERASRSASAFAFRHSLELLAEGALDLV